MGHISRRRFLKIAGLGAGAAALAAGGGRTLQAMARKPPAGETRTVPTSCDLCFWKCNAIAHVRDGQLWKIVGNPEDPLSRGRLCPRGTGGIGAYFDPDRLRAPLIRRTERADEEWVGGHLGRSARLRRRAHAEDQGRRRPGGDRASSATASAATSSSTPSRPSARPNIAAPSFAQCRGPRDVGFELTFGEGIGTPERTDIATPAAWCSSARTSARTCTTARSRNSPKRSRGRHDHRRRSRDSRSRRARRSTTCRSGRAPTSRCCWPG